MKNTVQVRKNGATKPVPSQRKTSRRQSAKPLPEFKIPADAKMRECICIYDREQQMPVAKVPLTENEFEVFRSHRQRPGQPTMQQYIADAVREKQAGPRGLGMLDELEFAKNQSQALIQLMLDSETTHMMEGDFNHEARRRFGAGLAALVLETNRRLETAFNSIFSAITGKPEVAS